MSLWYRRGDCAQDQDVLDYIEWVFGLQAREEHRSNPDAEWYPDMSWQELDWDTPIKLPGDVERPDPVHDVLLPEYVGLLDTQLYWPGKPPLVVT